MESGSAVPPLVKPANVQELVKAWKVSGRKAQVLETRLQRAVDVARRYRRDLLRLAQQNRSRKLQADGLQQKLLQLLEQRAPEGLSGPTPVPELPGGDESVPAESVRQLLVRLREAHDLVAEFETLLEFREKQVHELLSRPQAGAGGEDWRLFTLQRELTEARHRIRLLTQELAQQQPTGAGAPEGTARRVAELEQQLAALAGQGDAALQAQLQQREQQVGQLQEQLATRLEELKKAVATIHAARDRIRTLEHELESARQSASQSASQSSHDEAGELLIEVTNLQDEIAHLQEENEELRGENSQLKAQGGDPQRNAKLEAAVVDLRQKLQLAGSKYQEVKAALIEKHQQLIQLQSRSVELEKSSDLIQHSGRTLESALAESKKQNAVLQSQLEALRKAGPGGAAPDASEALASMETKLKEARRSAVRAQAEAGMKRKEMAKLQEEVNQLKAQVVQLGGTVG
jgi:chromosome segregation ATPase